MNSPIEQLIVLGSTTTALALVRNAHRLGIKCVLVDTKAGVAVNSRMAKVKVLHSAADEVLVEYLIALATERPSALIADSDNGLRVLVLYRKSLGLAFRQILHPDNDVLNICLDKKRFLAWCANEGLPAPKLYLEGSLEQSARFPLMVRPTTTRHGIQDGLSKASEVRDGKELTQILGLYKTRDVDACVCDSLLASYTRQYSVGVVRNATGGMRVFVAEKIRPSARFCGGGTYVVGSPEDAVADLASRAIETLEYFGIAEVEILKDQISQRMSIVEINPRPWVQYALAWRSGFDFLAFLLAPESYDINREKRTGRRWLNWGDDLYVTFSRSEGMLIRRELNVISYLMSILTANVFPLWEISDPKPLISDLKTQIFGARIK